MMPNAWGPRSGAPVNHTRAPTRLWRSSGGLPRGIRRSAVRRYRVLPSCSSTPSTAGCPSTDRTVKSRTTNSPPGEEEPRTATSSPAIRRREGSSAPVRLRLPPPVVRSSTWVTGAFPTTVIVPWSLTRSLSDGDGRGGEGAGGRAAGVLRPDSAVSEREPPLGEGSFVDGVAASGEFGVSPAAVAALLSTDDGSARESPRSTPHALATTNARVVPNGVQRSKGFTSCGPAPPPRSRERFRPGS